MKRLFDAPHRLFFFAAVLQLLCASAWWAWVLAARARGIAPPLGAGLDVPHAHAFLMLYAFFPLFIFGFLFTAGPRWLSVPAPALREYGPMGVVAGLVGLLLHAAIAISSSATAGVALGLVVTLLWILQRFVRMIASSPVPDRLHARLVAVGLAFGIAGLAAMPVYMVTNAPLAAEAMELVGLWGF